MVDKLAILVIALFLFAILFCIWLYISIKHHFIEKNMTDDYDIDDDMEFTKIESIKEEIPDINRTKIKKNKKGRNKKNKMEKL